MKKSVKAYLMAAASAPAVFIPGGTSAEGLEHGMFTPDFMFKRGNYIEASMAKIAPSKFSFDLLSGLDSDVAPGHNNFSGAIKFDITNRLAIGVSTFQPLEASLNGKFSASDDNAYRAHFDSRAYSALAKFRLFPEFSIYGGAIYATLAGKAASDTKNFSFSEDGNIGFIAGAAYALPNDALTASITYESAVKFKLNTSASDSDTGFVTTGQSQAAQPASIRIALDAGNMEDGRIHGSARFIQRSGADFKLSDIDTKNLTGFADATIWNVGIEKQFIGPFSLGMHGSYTTQGAKGGEAAAERKLSTGASLSFRAKDRLELTGSATYSFLLDKSTEATRLGFSQDGELTLGAKAGFHF